ncbi:MAG: hypothetical protein ACRENO_03175 [Thermodesulfobacteriota bacterium]
MKKNLLFLTICILLPSISFAKDDETRINEIKEIIESIENNPEKVRKEGQKKLTDNIFSIDNNSTIENELIPLLFDSLKTDNNDQVFFMLYQLHWFYCNKIGSLIYDGKEVPNLSLSLENKKILNEKLIELIEKTENDYFVPYSVLDCIYPVPDKEIEDYFKDILKSEDILKNYGKYAMAINILGRFRPVSIENIDILKDEILTNNINYKKEAMRGLVKTISGNPDTVNDLIEFIENDDEKIRELALKNLNKITSLIKKNEELEKQIEDYDWRYFEGEDIRYYGNYKILNMLKESQGIRDELIEAQIDFIDLSLDKNETVNNRKLAMILGYNINEYKDDFLRSLYLLTNDRHPVEVRIQAFILLSKIKTRPPQKFVKTLHSISTDENQSEKIKSLASKSFQNISQLPNTKTNIVKYIAIGGVLLVLLVLLFLVKKLKLFRKK